MGQTECGAVLIVCCRVASFNRGVFVKRLEKDERALPRAYKEHMGGHSYFTLFRSGKSALAYANGIRRKGMLILS